MRRSRNLKLSTGGQLVPGTGFCFRWKSAKYWPTRLPFAICSLPTETCWSWGVSCDCVLMKPLLASLAGMPITWLYPVTGPVQGPGTCVRSVTTGGRAGWWSSALLSVGVLATCLCWAWALVNHHWLQTSDLQCCSPCLPCPAHSCDD